MVYASNNLKRTSSSRGITLIEILVVVFIIALFSSILVTDFPKIKRQFALTRAVYKMSQDLRRTQDMGFSGQQIEGLDVKGYGVYINLNDANLRNKKYIIYADRGNTPDQKYSEESFVDCRQQTNPQADCVIEEIDLSQTEPEVIINTIENTADGRWVDINFAPPNPATTITELAEDSSGTKFNRAMIIFAIESEPLKERMVSVNTSGLIEIK